MRFGCPLPYQQTPTDVNFTYLVPCSVPCPLDFIGLHGKVTASDGSAIYFPAYVYIENKRQRCHHPSLSYMEGAHPQSAPAMNLRALRITCSYSRMLLTSLRTFPRMYDNGKDEVPRHEQCSGLTAQEGQCPNTRKWESSATQAPPECRATIPGIPDGPRGSIPYGGCWEYGKAWGTGQGADPDDVPARPAGLGSGGPPLGCGGYDSRAAARHQAQERRPQYAPIEGAGIAMLAGTSPAVPGFTIPVHQRTECTHDGLERAQAGNTGGAACQIAVSGTPAHAPAFSRLQTGQCRPRHAQHSALSRPQVNHAHRALYRAVSGAVQELFPRLTAVASLAGAAS